MKQLHHTALKVAPYAAIIGGILAVVSFIGKIPGSFVEFIEGWWHVLAFLLMALGFSFFWARETLRERRKSRRDDLDRKFEKLDKDIQSLQRQVNDDAETIRTRVTNVVRQFIEFKKAVNESQEEGGQMVADGIRVSLDNLLADLSDPNLTDLQKSQIVERHQDKRVRWEGLVKQVRRGIIGGDIYLHFYPPSQSEERFPENIIMAIFPSTAESRLSELSEHDWILIEGTMDFGTGKEPCLEDAELIDVKRASRDD